MIVVYDPNTQLPIYSINQPYPEGTESHYEELSLQDPSFLWGNYSSNESIIGKYVEVGEGRTLQLLDRTTVPGQPNAVELSVGEDFILSGVPSGTKVSLGSESWVVNDGEFAFSSDIIGTYTITLELLPHLETEHKVTFQ